MPQLRDTQLAGWIKSELDSKKYSYSDDGADKSFITAPTLNQIWNTVSIQDLFIQAKWNITDHDTVRSKFAKIISILIQIEWPRLLTHFESLFFDVPGRTDAKLPFSMDGLEFFDQSSRAKFFATQYTYTPFVIEEGGPEKDLSNQIVLPFEADPREVGKGSFGKVYVVKVPRGYLKYRTTDGGSLNNGTKELAFKQFPYREEYKRELDSLNVLSQSSTSHSNITRHTQAVSQGDWFRIFFPYATLGSLKDLFKESHESRFSSFCFSKENLVSALHRMIDGVAHLHAHNFVQTHQLGSYKYGAHLDLKPANILVFSSQSEEQGVGIWKISDFGISSFKDVKDRIPSPENSGPGNTGASGTSTGRRAGLTGPRDQLGECCAPELHPSMNESFQGRPVDIWSIGCMLSNVVCFALDRGVTKRGVTEDGVNGIERYRNNRVKGCNNDYCFEVIEEDKACCFKLKDAVPIFLEKLLTDYSKERRWVKDCLEMVARMLQIDPSKRPGVDKVRADLAGIKFVEYEGDPFESWTDEVAWDKSTFKSPNTRPIAQSGESRSQEAIDNDPWVSIDVSTSHAELPLRVAHMTLKESGDEHQDLLRNELSQSSDGLAAETDGNEPALLRHESSQILHSPSTRPPITSDSAGQELEARLVQGNNLHSIEHMFPDINIHDHQSNVPNDVYNNVEWWLESKESRSLWICVPELPPGWETNHAQVWANSLRLKVSESGLPVLCYCVKDMNLAISEPMLEIARTLNSQMVRYKIDRCPAQHTYVANNLHDALVDLRRHLANISKSLSGPIFCIIHGLENLNGFSRQGIQSFLRVLDECTAYRLKTLLTTNGDSKILEELKSLRKCSPLGIDGEYPLSGLVMPSY